MKQKFILILFLPLLFSCSKKLAYFADLETEGVYTEQIEAVPKEPVIRPGDRLKLTVTSLNPEANLMFNQGEISVDNKGAINVPVLGAIQIAGLPKSDVEAKLNGLLVEYLKEPYVTVAILNYQITVLGEVRSPSTFTVSSERINLLEALGRAGDLTVYGNREKVMIIREEEGVRSIAALNLKEKDVLNSPYFYLQPDDVVYVEPIKAKAAQTSRLRDNLTLFISIASFLGLILFRFIDRDRI